MGDEGRGFLGRLVFVAFEREIFCKIEMREEAALGFFVRRGSVKYFV